MQTNADITVYNKVYDPEKRTDKWIRTVLYGVHKYTNARATQVNGVERKQNEGIFRIPDTCSLYDYFLPEEDFNSINNHGTYWTLRPEDLIVVGVCSLEINGESTLISNHIRPWKITSVSDNRRGTTPHLRARCE